MITLGTLPYLILLLGAIHLAGIFCILQALLHTRSSQGAIAWSLFLIMLPYFAVPLYLIFGRSHFNGYETIKGKLLQLDSAHSLKLREEFFRNASPHRSGINNFEEKNWENIFKRPFLSTNSIKLLVDGTETFQQMLQDIKNAREYVLFQFYIIRDDGLGREIASLLKQKASEGVRVYVLFDEIGSAKLSQSYIADLVKGGVLVSPFNTRQGILNKFQLNFRNHRKIVVVDGSIAFVGGHNVGDEYLGKSSRFGNWHDLHLRIEGPESAALQLIFMQDWAWATRDVIQLKWDASKGPGNSSLITLPTGPADKFDLCTMMFLQAINSAKERVWIASPYFVPEDSIRLALQLAACRGVDVRILLPKNPDHYLVWLASYAYIPALISAGARMFKFKSGFLHAKSFVVDDCFSMVGTPNLDNRSLRLNFEVATIASDKEFSSELSGVFARDFEKSEEITKESVAGWSLILKIGSKLANLLSPIL